MTESLSLCRIEVTVCPVLKALAKICRAANMAKIVRILSATPKCSVYMALTKEKTTREQRRKEAVNRPQISDNCSKNRKDLVCKKCQLEMLKQFDKHGENK